MTRVAAPNLVPTRTPSHSKLPQTTRVAAPNLVPTQIQRHSKCPQTTRVAAPNLDQIRTPNNSKLPQMTKVAALNPVSIRTQMHSKLPQMTKAPALNLVPIRIQKHFRMTLPDHHFDHASNFITFLLQFFFKFAHFELRMDSGLTFANFFDQTFDAPEIRTQKQSTFHRRQEYLP